MRQGCAQTFGKLSNHRVNKGAVCARKTIVISQQTDQFIELLILHGLLGHAPFDTLSEIPDLASCQHFLESNLEAGPSVRSAVLHLQL